jgi:3-isopropylmalate/(R)-2-methylmalate dehydratase small subunit
MQPFEIITGAAIPLLRANIDTDIIIRIERLTQGDRTRLGDYALEALKFMPDGLSDPSSPLNWPRYRDAPILIAGRNFGCGSSREGAVWALWQMGVRAVIADSFGDIFYANCFQNGLLPIRLPEAEVERLAALAAGDGASFTIDLDRQVVALPDRSEITFEIDRSRRDAMLAGLDDIGLTLRDTDAIEAWQKADRIDRPWVWQAANVA